MSYTLKLNIVSKVEKENPLSLETEYELDLSLKGVSLTPKKIKLKVIEKPKGKTDIIGIKSVQMYGSVAVKQLEAEIKRIAPTETFWNELKAKFPNAEIEVVVESREVEPTNELQDVIEEKPVIENVEVAEEKPVIESAESNAPKRIKRVIEPK